jgi:hypothetical protein
METRKVGIREFREKLALFLESSGPLAVTRHGETMGFYIPAHRTPRQADLEALRQAAEELDRLLARAGAEEQDLVRDFKSRRRVKRNPTP